MNPTINAIVDIRSDYVISRHEGPITVDRGADTGFVVLHISDHNDASVEIEILVEEHLAMDLALEIIKNIDPDIGWPRLREILTEEIDDGDLNDLPDDGTKIDWPKQ